MKRAFLALLLVILCVAAAYELAAARREREFLLLVERGEAALGRDDTFAAIEGLSGAIALKADSMLGYLKRGRPYRRRHQLDASLREPGGNSALDPAADAAMRDLRRAAELDPLAPRPLELIGDVSYALRRYDRAAERYQAYVDLDDRSPRVLYKLALAHYTAGRPLPAVRALQQAVVLNERFAEAFYLLGLCYRDLQKPRESLRALETAVRIAPALVQAHEELADLYGRLGRRESRIGELEALARLQPAAARHVALGLAYARAGQFDRAVATLGHAAELDPDHPEHAQTYVALGRIWLDKAQPPDRADLVKAVGALEGAAASGESSEALMLLGRALLLSDEPVLAEGVLQRATAKLPVEPLAFYYLASAAERCGHPDIARRALVDYRALEGVDADPRRRAAQVLRIAELSMEAKDPAGAATWYQRALAAGAPDLALLVRLAEAQFASGARDAARASVRRALEIDSASPSARALQRRLR